MSEVRVIIQDNLNGNETITKNTPSLTPNVNEKRLEASGNSAQVAANQKASKNLAIATMLAKQSFSYVTSNIGKWTGNSHNQAIINNATDIIGLGILAYINPAVAAATVALRFTTTALDQAWEDRVNSLTTQRTLARQGFNSVGEAIGYRRNK